MRRQAGFTLIELITVVVILGILSVFALPRFAGLEAQARAASLQGLGGSINSGAALVHSVWLARGGGAGAVTVEGQAVTIDPVTGYPTAAAAGIQRTISDTSPYQVGVAGGVITFNYPNVTPANCKVTYQVGAVAGTPPTVAVTTTGGTGCS